MKIVLIILGALFFIFFGALYYVGVTSPETSVYLGAQLPKKYLDEINNLELLDDGEDVKYFYTDAFKDIKNGLYFVTDNKIAIYNKNWGEPKIIIPYEDIESLDALFDDSFFTDSFFYVRTKSGTEVEFPMSSEKNRDRIVYDFIQDHITQNPDLDEENQEMQLELIPPQEVE